MSPWLRKGAAPRAWGLDASHVAWRAGSGTASRTECDHHAGGMARALADLPDGAQVDLVAANDLAVHWLQVPPAGLRSLAELKAVAAARCAQLHGGAPGDWHVGGDWSASHPFICAALPRALVEPLRAQLARRRQRGRWHTAWGLLCQHAARRLPGDGWVAARSPRRLLLWHNQHAAVNHLVTFAVDPTANDRQVIADAMQRLHLERHHLEGAQDATPAALHWVNLCAAPAVSANLGVQPVALPAALPAPDPGATLHEAVAALNLHARLGGGARA